MSSCEQRNSVSEEAHNPFTRITRVDFELSMDSVIAFKAEAKALLEVKNIPPVDLHQNWLQAELLYGQAIMIPQHLATSDAVLFANRAAVRLRLSDFFPDRLALALDDANQCLFLDSKYVKGCYRKTQTLLKQHRWDLAIVVAQQALVLQPGHKPFLELIAQADLYKQGWRHIPPHIMPNQPAWLSDALNIFCSADSWQQIQTAARSALRKAEKDQYLSCLSTL